MSKSNPKIENPCKKFIDYKGDKGQFFFYDKELEEQIEIEIPIYFVVLDELSTISGYNKKNDCGIYSNEVHRTTDEILRVKTFKGGESITGFYNDIKDAVKGIGGKYTKSVYAMLIGIDKQPELVNFKFKGAAFSAWLEKKMNPDNCIIGIVEFTEERNGNTVYQVPVFKSFKLTPEFNNQAIEMDKELQEYLKEYKAQQPEKEIAKAEAAEETISNEKWQGSANKEAIVNKSKSITQEEDDLPF
jgi:hypothetical protein